MNQGDIWLVDQPDDRVRPHLVLTRDRAIPVLGAVVAAPLTRTVRGIATEVALGLHDGVAVDCVASFDNVRLVKKSRFIRCVGHLAPGRWHEVCAAMSASIDC